jgi:hypothetical protein
MRNILVVMSPYLTHGSVHAEIHPELNFNMKIVTKFNLELYGNQHVALQ